MNKTERLGCAIKQQRQNLGNNKGRKVPQQEIADKIKDVGRSGYSKWEKGETLPDPEKWDDIERALEVSTGWLVSQMYESFCIEAKGAHSIEEKPKPCVTKLCTNHHMDDIAAWINTQDEPEMHWAELKSHLRRLEPDFAEFLKKRTSKNIPDTTNQSTGTD